LQAHPCKQIIATMAQRLNSSLGIFRNSLIMLKFWTV